MDMDRYAYMLWLHASNHYLQFIFEHKHSPFSVAIVLFTKQVHTNIYVAVIFVIYYSLFIEYIRCHMIYEFYCLTLQLMLEFHKFQLIPESYHRFVE